MADPDSTLARILRRFAYEHHIHGHASQWSAPNYVYHLTEEFVDIKCQHDAKKLLLDESSRISYKILWLRSSPNHQLETRLRSGFDSLEIYDDRKMCLDYTASIDRSALTIYLIVDNEEYIVECENIKIIYRIDSYENINQLILQLRSEVRSDTTSPIRPVEKSVRRFSGRYAPFVSLWSHVELFLALYRDVDDRKRMKEEMLNACRLIYQNDASEQRKIDEFDKIYSDEPDVSSGRAVFSYTRKYNIHCISFLKSSHSFG